MRGRIHPEQRENGRREIDDARRLRVPRTVTDVEHGVLECVHTREVAEAANVRHIETSTHLESIGAMKDEIGSEGRPWPVVNIRRPKDVSDWAEGNRTPG